MPRGSDVGRPFSKSRSSQSLHSVKCTCATCKADRVRRFSIRSNSSSSSHSQRRNSILFRRRLRDRERAEQSFEEIINGNGANQEPMEQLLDEDEESQIVVNPENPNPSHASKAMKKFVTGLVSVYTIIGKDPESAGHSIFRRMMVTLHVTLTYGYYLCLVPFKIVERDGSYKYETMFLQQTLTWLMQIILLYVLGVRAGQSIYGVDINKTPNSLCDSMSKSLTFMLALAFIYSVSIRGRRFFNIFNSFNTRICYGDQKNQNRWKNGLIQLLPFLIYFAISNWRTWTSFVPYKKSITAYFIVIYQEGLKSFYLEHIPNWTPYFYFVISIYIPFSLYVDVWTYYVHALLWAAAITVYVCEKKSRKVSFESKQRLSMNERSVLFNNQRILMRKLNLALGPIIVVFYNEVIPFTVYTICEFFVRGNFLWSEFAMIPLKMGHIFIACEACSNADDLTYDILVKKVDAVPEEIENMPNDRHRTYYLKKYSQLVDKFRDIVTRAICLRAMDYCAVTYSLIGSIAPFVLTSALLIAEWSRDSGSKVEGKVNILDEKVDRLESQMVILTNTVNTMMTMMQHIYEAQNRTISG